MNRDQLSRFDELVSRYLDESLSKVDEIELVALLAQPSLTSRFLEMTRLNSEIAGLLAAPVPDAAMVELVGTDIKNDASGAQPHRAAELRIVERNQESPSIQNSMLPAPKQRHRAMWQPLAWAAVFLMLAGLAAFFLVKRASSAHAAIVAVVQGDVRLVGPNGERTLTVDQSWQLGEKIRTVGLNSAVTIMLRDGSQLDFGGNAIAVNQTGKAGNRFELEHGEMQADVVKQAAGKKFVLRTPEAEATVVGTKLRLVTGAHHTRLEVTEGEVQFRRRLDGSEVAVRSGYFALVAPNVPLAAKPIHADPHHVQ